MKLSFHGADRDVTGSCHLLECLGRRILVDCGMLQGSRELSDENAQPFGFDPRQIDWVLLTHAHLDHCGRLPLLVKRGFRGEVITTAASRELARLVIADAAHLQEEEAKREARHAARRADRGGHLPGRTNAPPLYTMDDAFHSFDCFGRVAEYGQPLLLAPGIRATFFDAGHILGSASILLEVEEAVGWRSVLFSGDLGNAGRPLLSPPAPPGNADVVVMESTYGDRGHRSMPDSVDELCRAVSETFARGGNVVIPTFALERAQEILFFLRQGIDAGKLAASTQVFLDSPLAISATEIFERHPECLNDATAQMFRDGHDPFLLPNLHFTRDAAESMAINEVSRGAIIMAGSGMCTGGRVRHHLKHNLGRPECAVLFVGYAARGTLARIIIDGARHVRLFDEDVPVRARIHTINGFSAHADQDELLAWRSGIRGAKATFLVHGEEPAMQALAQRLPGPRIEMPRLNDAFEL